MTTLSNTPRVGMFAPRSLGKQWVKDAPMWENATEAELQSVDMDELLRDMAVRPFIQKRGPMPIFHLFILGVAVVALNTVMATLIHDWMVGVNL